jgi:hypothetical protein
LADGDKVDDDGEDDAEDDGEEDEATSTPWGERVRCVGADSESTVCRAVDDGEDDEDDESWTLVLWNGRRWSKSSRRAPFSATVDSWKKESKLRGLHLESSSDTELDREPDDDERGDVKMSSLAAAEGPL